MGRPAKGSVRWNAITNAWEVRVTLADGSRSKPIAMTGLAPCAVKATAPDKGCTCAPCVAADEGGKRVSRLAREGGGEDLDARETADEWHDRYLGVHESLGKLTREMRGSWRTCVAPFIGETAIAAVKREQIVAIRDALTRRVLAGNISAKRAMNLWCILITSPFARAFSDDDPRYSSVRVAPAAANPVLGVKPPVTKEQLDSNKRERQPLYPHEFARMMACETIPTEWKRIYALAAFLYVRPEEFYALRWSDVDWEAEEIRIRRALDVRTGEEKKPKTKAAIREVPIHPNLLPLLRAMHKERAADDARIIPLVGSTRLFERFADKTRRHIQLAGIARKELLAATEDHLPFDFRSWRTTGTTWLAMVGTDSYVIARQAGHETPETTWSSYIKRGPDLRRRYGEPFPPLPPALENPLSGFGRVSVERSETGLVFSGNSAERAGFEPAVGF